MKLSLYMSHIKCISYSWVIVKKKKFENYCFTCIISFAPDNNFIDTITSTLK